MAAIGELKRRNPRFGFRRIAQQIAFLFGVESDKDVVRRVLAKHCRPTSGSGGLLGYKVDRDRVRPRAGLRIFTFGSHGDLIDERGHFKHAYGVASGDWVLVRPDGYIGAMVASRELPALQSYLDRFLNRSRREQLGRSCVVSIPPPASAL